MSADQKPFASMRRDYNGVLHSPCCDAPMTDTPGGATCNLCGGTVIRYYVQRLPEADERQLRAEIAAQISAHADDDSDVSDAYRHAALIATQGATE